jgi:hypothetical protein
MIPRLKGPGKSPIADESAKLIAVHKGIKVKRPTTS